MFTLDQQGFIQPQAKDLDVYLRNKYGTGKKVSLAFLTEKRKSRRCEPSCLIPFWRVFSVLTFLTAYLLMPMCESARIVDVAVNENENNLI